MAIEKARPGLQILSPKPLRQRHRSRIWCPGVNGHLLPTLRLCLSLWLLPRRGLLLSKLLLPLMALESFLFELGDILLKCEPCLFGIGFELGTLGSLKLLRGHTALLRFDSHLLLHCSDLLRSRLLPGHWWGDRHSGE